MDAESGATYYHNAKTNETTWIRPSGSGVVVVMGEEEEEVVVEAAEAAASGYGHGATRQGTRYLQPEDDDKDGSAIGNGEDDVSSYHHNDGEEESPREDMVKKKKAKAAKREVATQLQGSDEEEAARGISANIIVGDSDQSVSSMSAFLSFLSFYGLILFPIRHAYNSAYPSTLYRKCYCWPISFTAPSAWQARGEDGISWHR